MQDSLKFWDGIAARYAKSPIRNMDAYEQTLERSRSYLSDQDRVLELGSGTGTTAIALAPAAGQVLATDISDKMLEIARARAQEAGIDNLSFAQAGVGDPLPGRAAFDVVMGFNLVHLLPDTAACLKAIHAQLRPGGLFISKTVCLGEKGGSWKLKLIKALLPLAQAFGKAPYLRLMRITELETHIITAGFDIIETGCYPASPPSRFIVARKR